MVEQRISRDGPGNYDTFPGLLYVSKSSVKSENSRVCATISEITIVRNTRSPSFTEATHELTLQIADQHPPKAGHCEALR